MFLEAYIKSKVPTNFVKYKPSKLMGGFIFLEAIRINSGFYGAKGVKSINGRNNSSRYLFHSNSTKPFSTSGAETTLFTLSETDVNFSSEIFLNDYVKAYVNSTNVSNNE